MDKSHMGAGDNCSSSIHHGAANASRQLLIGRLLDNWRLCSRRLDNRGLLRRGLLGLSRSQSGNATRQGT
jgi:hypothetical protein